MKVKDFSPAIRNLLYSFQISQGKAASDEMEILDLNWNYLLLPTEIVEKINSGDSTFEKYINIKQFYQGVYYKSLKNFGALKKNQIVKAITPVLDSGGLQHVSHPYLVDEKTKYTHRLLNYSTKGDFWDYPTPQELNETFNLNSDNSELTNEEILNNFEELAESFIQKYESLGVSGLSYEKLFSWSVRFENDTVSYITEEDLLELL